MDIQTNSEPANENLGSSLDRRNDEGTPQTKKKRLTLSSALKQSRKEGLFLTKSSREQLQDQADEVSASAYAEVCSLFNKSLDYSKQIADSLVEKTTSKKDSALDLSLFSGGTLRDYQYQGTSWIVNLKEQGLSGILADEMGLGKTAQSIATICHLVATGSPGPFLILGPLSTLRNWENEFHRFAPALPVLVYHDQRARRPAVLRRIRIRHKLNDNSGRSIFPVVIAPYHMMVADLNSLVRFKWSYLVFDEASNLKNKETKISKSTSSLFVSGKLLLTGTPLQNNIRELFNLLNFVLPKIFHDYRMFETWVTELDSHQQEGSIGDNDSLDLVSTMHSILAPFFLRRTKKTVNLKLPPKKHIIVYCPLTQLQKRFYQLCLDKCHNPSSSEFIPIVYEDGKRPLRRCRVNPMENHGATKRANAENITPSTKRQRLSSVDIHETSLSDTSFASESIDDNLPVELRNVSTTNILSLLRKIVIHPWLIDRDLAEGFYTQDKNQFVAASGKLQVFDLLLTALLARGHKVLVFSQFVQALDIIEYYLELSGIAYFYLNGSTDLNVRQEQVDAFNKSDSEEKVFLVSTRAGGMGINLIGADTAIFYDTDWNPQVDLQAADRCHRIGQEKPVVIYRLICKETVDQRILDFTTSKRRLEKLILKCGRFEKVSSLKDLTKTDLLKVLRAVDWDQALDGDLLDPQRMINLADRDFVFQKDDSSD